MKTKITLSFLAGILLSVSLPAQNTAPVYADSSTGIDKYMVPAGAGEALPKDCSKVKKLKLKWHAIDSRSYNVKLFRFATNITPEKRYGVIFWAATAIYCDEDIPGCSESLCLVSIADSTPGLGVFDFNSDNCKWDLKWRGAIEAKNNDFVFEGNPLFRDCYTADPAPMIASDGRLYVFCGHDEQYDDRPGYEGKYGFNITEWLCYSTADMKTWTPHGVVMKPTDFSWAVGEAWASQCIEANGKYYFYVSCQSGEPNCKAIGVAVADSPTGPYRDAIGKALILDDMTPNGPRGWWNDFDPTVMVDDDGTPWLCWGNGTCFLAPLKKNMVELDGEIRVLPMENYVEGPWLYKRNGWYYNVYASMGTGDELMGRGGETISYAMAPSLDGPWEFKGQLTGPARDSFTIHPGVIDFKGHSYLFYHNAALSLDGYGPATGRRSVCVDELFYAPDGSLLPVLQTE